MSDTMTELREFLTTKVAKQNLEFAADRDLWKAEAERMTSGYDAAQSELAALREELDGYRAANMALRDELKTERLRADAAVGDANDAERSLAAAEQRNSALLELLRDIYNQNELSGFDEQRILEAIQPTESGASEKCLSDGGTCGLGGQCHMCPHKESGASE